MSPSARYKKQGKAWSAQQNRRRVTLHPSDAREVARATGMVVDEVRTFGTRRYEYTEKPTALANALIEQGRYMAQPGWLDEKPVGPRA